MDTIDPLTEYNTYNQNCPTRTVLDSIANKWTVLVLGMMEKGPQRFSAFQHGIGGITQKMLTQTLRKLERDGLVKRTVYPVVPPHVEYELTPLGVTLMEPVKEIRKWAEEHILEITAAHAVYDREHLK